MKKRKFISFFLLTCILGQIFTSFTLFAKDSTDDIVTISISCNNDEIDLSQISFNIHKTVLIDTDNEEGYYTVYDKIYTSTEYLDSNGIAQVIRPSELFSISFNLDSLPNEYGINQSMHVFQPNENSFNTFIDTVSTVDLTFDNGEWIPNLYDSKGNQLNILGVNIESNTKSTSYEDNTNSNEIYFEKEFTVNVSNQKFNVIKNEIYKYEDIADKSNVLYANGLINEKEHAENIAKYFLNGSSDHISTKTDATCMYMTLKSYVENHKGDEITNNQTRALNSIENKSVSATYENYVTVGRFRVYYNDPVKESTAKLVAEEFDAVDGILCGICKFKRPAASQQYYDIELTNFGYDGMTYYRNGIIGSEISVGTANHLAGLVSKFATNRNGGGTKIPANASTGVIAHEYFHAIMYSYNIFPEKEFSRETWMHESFASAIGCIYEDDYAYLKAGQVREFLRTSYLPLTDYLYNTTNRYYGSLLFPMYIHRMMGGYSTIRQILSSYVGDSIAAIKYGLQLSGYTFKDALAGCYSFNSDADYFYHNSSDVDYFWAKSNISSYNVLSLPENPHSASVQGLSCHYNEFCLSNTPTTMTLLMNIDYSVSSNADPAINTVSNLHNIQKRSLGTNGLLISVRGMGSTVTSLLFIPVNAGLSGKFEYTWSISVS